LEKKLHFNLLHTDKSCKARAGEYHTDHGVIETPIFMPVGTRASVKTQSPRDLLDIEAQIILGNTYHLYMRPGAQRIADFGGLHKFMGWPRPILTDSGGYQVFSLKELRKIEKNGVRFQSHLDGSYHMFTPESVLDTQRMIGSDIMMVLDECPPHPASYEYVKKANTSTLRWAQIARDLYSQKKPLHGCQQALFGIVQGGVFKDLRELSARGLIEMDFPGYAIGGLAVGEAKTEMHDTVDFCTDILPANKPRYLMGVGTPQDILEGIERGVDMFDCVMPTRNARNGTVFTRTGRVVIKAGRYKDDPSPIDSNCTCYACQNFSRAYIRHLLNVGEILGIYLTTHHNLKFYLDLVKEARKQISSDTFLSWKAEMLQKLSTDTNTIS